MASSLSELLADEGFQRGSRRRLEPRHNRDRIAPPENEPNAPLPLYICQGGGDHDRIIRRRRSSSYNHSTSSKKNGEKSLVGSGSSVFSSKRVGSVSERSNSKTSVSECSRREDEPLVDDVAARAVVSILSGYVGRYIKDVTFRENVREKCTSCLVRRKMDLGDKIFANLKLGIESVDKLMEDKGNRKEIRMKTVRNAVQLFSTVAALNTKKTKNGLSCGIPNSHLSSCAQFYLAIVYKIEKHDRTSARHLLRAFCDSPFLARTHLAPDLWEHFFLPHLLHLKVWYTKELDYLRDFDYGNKEKKMKALSQVYNDHMDKGTVEFAFYYKKWLKVGLKSPAVPQVPLPERPYNKSSRRSMDSSSTQSSINNLYRAVFGSIAEGQSSNDDNRNGDLKGLWGLVEEENQCADKDNYNNIGSFLHGNHSSRRSSCQLERNQKSETWRDTQKPDKFRLITCQNTVAVQIECLLNGNSLSKNSSVRKKEENTYLPTNLSRAIASICSSKSLRECEVAIRVITKAWLDSNLDPVIEAALSKLPAIEGMLEVLFASDDDEVLELVISILAELVVKNEMNRLIVLNSDAQLEIFMRHLRSNSLFLKAAVLLYLSKPKAKQMISVEWAPLVLRVIEFGDQMQTLFTIQCRPIVAAFYLLDQLLTGFDEDRNLDNARQVVSLGGLSLLASKIERGDAVERTNAAVFLLCCIRADGSCRNYLADSLNIDYVLELIVLECHKNPSGSAFSLLMELLCLSRRTQIHTILDRLKDGWGGLNTMHIFFVHLQKVPLEERPLVAVILLQLDILGGLSKCSIYREEAVEAIIAALDCQACHEKVQEQSAKALLMLGGRFSYTGEASIESWLLEQAGFHECSTSGNSYQRPENREKEDAAEKWQRKAASVFFKSGNKRLLAALSDCIMNGIPCLARASLITVSWMCILHLIKDENMQTMAWSVLVPQLVASLDFDKDVEERVLASFSLLNLTKSSEECKSMLLSTEKGQLVSHLKHLRLVTWTAEELLMIISS